MRNSFNERAHVQTSANRLKLVPIYMLVWKGRKILQVMRMSLMFHFMDDPLSEMMVFFDRRVDLLRAVGRHLHPDADAARPHHGAPHRRVHVRLRVRRLAGMQFNRHLGFMWQGLGPRVRDNFSKKVLKI